MCLQEGHGGNSLTVRRIMSRRIEVIQSDGSCRRFGLSIAVVSIDSKGIVLDVQIKPFEREIAGVEYYDKTLVLKPGEVIA